MVPENIMVVANGESHLQVPPSHSSYEPQQWAIWQEMHNSTRNVTHMLGGN